MNGFTLIGLISIGVFLVIILIIFFGFIAAIKAGIFIFHNKNPIIGCVFLVISISCLSCFSYVALAKYSKANYSVLGMFESFFWTGVTYDNAYILKNNNKGDYLAYTKSGDLFTGVSASYYDRLRLSPFKPIQNGLSYFVDGYLIGSSQNPNEPLKVSQIPKKSIIQKTDAPFLIHKDYNKHIDEEIKEWGNFFITDNEETAFNPNYKVIYATSINNNKITKREISIYKNGIVASIKPYYHDNFDKWNSGNGNYLVFDSLGFLIKKERWNKDGTIDYIGFTNEDWKNSDFVYMKNSPDSLKKNESQDKELFNKLFHPDKPDFLKNSEKWKKDNRNFDNFYLLFGGKPDYTEKVGVTVFAKKNGNVNKFNLNEKTGGIFASALAAGKLITTANDKIDSSSDGEEFKFVLFIEKKEVCSFLFYKDKFFMDNGIYAISLLPKDAENDTHKFYMDQSRNELINMLEELTGTDIDRTIYITSEY